jgi:hypothetical protein
MPWPPSSCSRRARPANTASTWSPTNGQIIGTSEAYESKASALKGIESVKRNASSAEVDDQTKS